MAKGDEHKSHDGKQLEKTTTPEGRIVTPEPIGPEVVESMHKRAVELKGGLSKGKGKESTVEHELVDMVLRGTNYAMQLQSQLHDQAETISLLIRQRDFILSRQDEERQMWEVEKKGWDRTAEALLCQVNKATPNFYREHEVNRHTVSLDADNLALRIKLSDAQARLSTLESELAHLKPILLMKPYALMHSDAPKHRKKKSAVAVGSDTNADGTDDAPAEDEVQQSPERRPRGQYYRQREQPLLANSPRKPGTSSRKATRVSMVDARTEHLLLAAKKIGRERASVLAAQNYQEQNDPKAGPSNIPMNQPSYKGKGRADGGTMFTFTEYVPKVPTTPTPKTPQKQTARTPAAAVTMSPSVPSAYANASPGFTSMVQPYTYIPPPVPASGYALFGAGPYTFPPPPPPTYPNTLNASPSRAPVASANNGQGSSSSLVSTPGGAHRPSDSNQPSTSGSNGPSTPFDKLITAARSVLSPAGVPESPTRNTNQDSSRPLGLAYSLPDNDGSPTPKRRKPSSARFAREANMSRTASALDVLADQAAVASSSPERHPNDDTVEADGGGMQEMSVAPVVDVGGVRGVFSAVDPFVPHPRAGQRRPRGRGARGALEPAARLTRSPRRGRGQGRAQTQAQRQTVQTQAVRSRTQSPADVDVRNGGHAVNEDARSDVSRQRSASVSSGAADPPGAAEDDVRSNRASTPGQDDVRQRWLAKLGR